MVIWYRHASCLAKISSKDIWTAGVHTSSVTTPPSILAPTVGKISVKSSRQMRVKELTFLDTV